MNRRLTAAATLPLFLLPSAAWAWPADDGWVAFRRGGADLTDPAGDQGWAGSAVAGVDILGDSTYGAAAYWYADDSSFYLRLRLNDTPWLVDGLELQSRSWAMLLDTDGAPGTFEYLFGVTGPGGTLAIYENLDGDTGLMAEADGPLWASYDAVVRDELRAVDAGSRIDGTTDWFLDFRYTRADLETVIPGFDRMSFSAAWATRNASGLESRGADLAGYENLDGGELDDGWTDDLGIDPDGDGLETPQEESLGTDPLDADSDDDGLSDGAEVEGAWPSDPLDCDSDDDGIVDSVEVGATAPTEDTAEDGCYEPDADPGSTTDPSNPDTDGDETLDGDEDRDADGALDPYETDPQDTNSGADLDGDGIADTLEDDCAEEGTNDDQDGDGRPDAEEGFADTDGDGVPDFCEPDDDADGLPTADESDSDSDSDGLPDYADSDSDNDGDPDGVEGTGDLDCDGILDYQDAVDDDGPCADPDADGLDNATEDACGSDPRNVDSDGDGVNDPDEACDEDEDCDLVPDRLDDSYDPEYCDLVDETPPKATCVATVGVLDCGHFAGGSCSTGAGAASLAPLAGAILLLRRRRRRAAWLGGLALVTTSTAHAQSINAQRFQPNLDSGSYFLLEDPRLAARGLGGGISFNYANDPLVYRYDGAASDGSTEVALLSDVFTADVGAFYTYAPVRVGAALPVHLASAGDLMEGGGHLGDLRLEVKVSPLPPGPFEASGSVRIGLPTGAQQSWLGEERVTGALIGAVAWNGPVRVAGNLGLHTGTGEALLPDLNWGPKLGWGIGVSYPLLDERLDIAGELGGESVLADLGAVGANPIEWRAGATYAVWEMLKVRGGLGTGITTGIGAPDLRAFAGVLWIPERPAKTTPTAVGVDTDGDGVPDLTDRCPEQREDLNGRNDQDGCPDGGLTPTHLEVRDDRGALLTGTTVELLSGPETGKYRLGDGGLTRSLPPGSYRIRANHEGFREVIEQLVVPDAEQHAHVVVLTAVSSGTLHVTVRDEAGKPVLAWVRVLGTDRHFTTGEDGEVRGPVAPGEPDLWVGAEGFRPERVKAPIRVGETSDVLVVLQPSRVTVTAERVEIREKVFFEFDSDVIKAQSFGILDDVAAALDGHPELVLVEVQGHTDDKGTEAYNLELSQRRAESVRVYLIRAGVMPERLVARGYGEGEPMVLGQSEEAWEANRRVVFRIMKKVEKESGQR